jgi:hypothetical protein
VRQPAGSSVAGPRGLAADGFERWLGLIEPRPEELRFEEIGWRPFFAQAVEEGRATDTPVLLWAMNGHALGAT